MANNEAISQQEPHAWRTQYLLKREEKCQVIQDFNYKSSPACLVSWILEGIAAISLVDQVNLVDSSNPMD